MRAAEATSVGRGAAAGPGAGRARVLLVALFVLLYLPFVYHHGWGYVRHYSVDFPSFYYAAQTAFELGRSPYPADDLPEPMASQALPYLYPPPTLVLLAPLAWLPFPLARVGLLGLSHVCLLAMIWLTATRLAGLEPERRPAAMGLVLVLGLMFHPIAVTLEHGQINLVLALALLLFWLTERAGRSVMAGALLAVAIALKTYPVLLLPLLVLVGRARVAGWTVAALACLSGVAALVVPGEAWGHWLAEVVPTGGYGRVPLGLFSPAAEWNQSLNGIFSRWFMEAGEEAPRGVGRALTYGVATVLMLATAWGAWRARRRTAGLDLTLAAGLPLTYLLAPLSWEHHLAYLWPGLVWMLLGREGRRRRWWLLAVLSAVLAMGPLMAKGGAVLGVWCVAMGDLLAGGGAVKNGDEGGDRAK